jgi:hypothetical protein
MFASYCKVGASPCSGSYTMKTRADIVGADIDCGLQTYQGQKMSYCQVSAQPVEAAASCSANPNCRAFTAIGTSNSYLKSSAGPPKYRDDSVVYVRDF